MLAPCLITARADWLAWLSGEKRMAGNSVTAYERDLRQFCDHLRDHHGRPPKIADFADLRPVHLRSYLARRRGQGVEARTLARDLSGIRSFVRWLERQGKASSAGLTALRAPKQPTTVPRPVTPEHAIRLTARLEHDLMPAHGRERLGRRPRRGADGPALRLRFADFRSAGTDR